MMCKLLSWKGQCQHLPVPENVLSNDRGGDGDGRRYSVAVESLEKINCRLEEVRDFFLRSVISVAACIKGTDTSSVLFPFMLPEGLVIAVDVYPVGIHIRKQVCLAI